MQLLSDNPKRDNLLSLISQCEKQIAQLTTAYHGKISEPFLHFKTQSGESSRKQSHYFDESYFFENLGTAIMDLIEKNIQQLEKKRMDLYVQLANVERPNRQVASSINAQWPANP